MLENQIEIKKINDIITIEFSVENSINEIEVHIMSDANQSIIEYSDDSDYAPGDAFTQAAQIFDISWAEQEQKKRLVDKNLYFPVVDVAVESGMEAVLKVNKQTPGIMVFNGNFIPKIQEVMDVMYFPQNELEHWENAILFDPNKNTIDSFGVRMILPNKGKISYTFRTLRPDWSGSIYVFNHKNPDGIIAETRIESVSKLVSSEKNKSEDRILNSLSETISYILKCVNEKKDSPTYGGLFLLYDMDARTFLRSDWPWTWGIAAILLLKATKLDGLKLDISQKELQDKAIAIAEATLLQQIKDPEHPAYGLVRTTNEPGSTWNHGFQNRASAADTLYLVGWAWVPFYRETGDTRYLEAAKIAVDAVGRLMDEYKGTMIPQAYDLKDETWYGHMFFETSMGLIGLSRVYVETKEDKYKSILCEFMGRLLKAFKREDGLWDTWIHEGDDTVAECNYFTKSFGYCVEGLIETHIALPEEGYLEQAEKIAELVLASQLEDGSWPVRWDRGEAEVGKTDKGTALWALLFMRLYKMTNQKKYKLAGEKAIDWCIDHQYFGDDLIAQGGIVGRSWTSGIVYRHWFDMITTYTMSFYGNAILEYLKNK